MVIFHSVLYVYQTLPIKIDQNWWFSSLLLERWPATHGSNSVSRIPDVFAKGPAWRSCETRPAANTRKCVSRCENCWYNMIWPQKYWIYPLVIQHSHGKSPLLIGKPSISMGHLYHGYACHNQRAYIYIYTIIYPTNGMAWWLIPGIVNEKNSPGLVSPIQWVVPSVSGC